jgi:hypothetical protein
MASFCLWVQAPAGKRRPYTHRLPQGHMVTCVAERDGPTRTAYRARLRLAAATALLEVAGSQVVDSALSDKEYFRLALTMQARTRMDVPMCVHALTFRGDP